MRSRWAIVSYIDASGCQPVCKYMAEEKNLTDMEVIIAAIQRLSRVGLALLDTNMAKRIDDQIYELRKDRHRILFAEDNSKGCFVLLSAFLKETQKTPLQEIEKAHRYWTDYQQTGKFQVFRLPVEEF